MLASSRVALARGLVWRTATVSGFSSTEGVSYAGEASDPVSLEPPENRVTTTKKVAILRTLSGKPRRELAPQGAGAQMLPPGCSMSDPSYTIKDQIYYQDPAPATK